MKQCHVKVYSLSTCSHCKDAKDLLNQCGAEYDCVDVDQVEPGNRQKLLEEIRKLNPECSFPTIVIGDKVIVGFRQEKIKEALESDAGGTTL